MTVKLAMQRQMRTPTHKRIPIQNALPFFFQQWTVFQEITSKDFRFESIVKTLKVENNTEFIIVI